LPNTIRVLLAAALLSAAAGCSSSGDDTQNPPPADTTPPSVPQNVTATAPSPTSVQITWSASTDTGGSGVAGYRLFRDGSTTALAQVTTTSYTDNTVVASTAYSYAVRAFDAAVVPNVSALSTAASITTPGNPPPADTTPPSVPQNVTATAPSPTSVQITWSASTDTGGAGLAGYRIFRNGSTTVLAEVTGTSYTDNTVVANTTYSYAVRAFDAAVPPNVSAPSAPANITTPTNPPPPDTTPPSVPQNVAATASSPTSVQVTWSASTDTGGAGVAGYRIFRNGSASVLAQVTGTSYTDNTVVASTTYSYAVRAFDAAVPPNVSALSAAANVTTPAPVSGLDTRPGNASCLAGAEPSSTVSIAVTRVFPNLTFNQPLLLLQAPGSTARWYVVEKPGIVRWFDNVSTASTSNVFVNITGRVDDPGERGLLGMAFHPNFPTDSRVFLSYTTTSESRLSVFTGSSTTLNDTTETVLMRVARTAENHNGGNIAFGPDGFLYWGLGDGGLGGDPFGAIGNGQNLQTILGKMLRINVGPAGSMSYTIPASNPYNATGGLCTTGTTTSAQCREIYAFGFRNPWRWSFDRSNGELWVGDVGQNSWEEVDRVVLGGNYGWRCREGAHDFNTNCGSLTPRLDPIAEYGRAAGQSLTGGYVYRGSAIPALFGRYVFGDYASGEVWHIATNTTPPPTIQVTAADGFNSNRNMSSFGQDANGELYIVDINNGNLYQITQGTGGGGSVATQLSASGCALASNPAQPSSGLIPYAPNAPFWSDGATKSRWIGLPNGQNILTGSSDGDWDFPNGTVLRKDFRLGTRLVETRLFMRHTSGNWAGYSYEWNAGGTDATRVIGGKTVLVNGVNWIFPSEAQCLTCHTAAAGRSLGLETAQLNGDLLYPTTGRTANQITTLNTIMTLSPPITANPSTLPAYRDPYGTGGTLTERARAYLHTNCSQCHRPSGTAPGNLDFRYSATLTQTNACNALPQNGDLGLTNARIIAPGVPASSVLVARMNTRGTNAMPPLASSQVDSAGVTLITNWISSLANCN
jgi:uncharacterized repeat protein (TIGR03806 family)